MTELEKLYRLVDNPTIAMSTYPVWIATGLNRIELERTPAPLKYANSLIDRDAY